MTLRTLALNLCVAHEPDPAARALIAHAEARERAFRARHPDKTTLIGSDPRQFLAGLDTLRAQNLPRGPNFCDWGSGGGLIVALAALRGLRAHGIEREASFVAESRALCAQQALPARFAHGSFVPSWIAGQFAVHGTYGATDWAATMERDVYAELGLARDALDLVYAYPWPREQGLYEALFDLIASPGALLWLYRQGLPPLLRCRE